MVSCATHIEVGLSCLLRVCGHGGPDRAADWKVWCWCAAGLIRAWR